MHGCSIASEHPSTEVHAEHQSEPQSCRSNTSAISSVALQTICPPLGAHQLMVIETGISLWRYLAQSQVDNQTHAERISHLSIYTWTSCYHDR